MMNSVPSDNSTAFIKSEIDSLRQGVVFTWGRISTLLDLIDKTGYWRQESRTFTLWIQVNEHLLGAKSSMLWRYLASGRFYQKLKTDFPLLAGKPLSEVSEELSPENIELLAKISRCAPDDFFKPLATKLLLGEAKRSELRAVWMSFRPILGGRTARGQGVVAPQFTSGKSTASDQLLETALIKNLLTKDSDWTKLKFIDHYKVFFDISVLGSKFDVVAITRGRTSALMMHGIKVFHHRFTINSHEFSELKAAVEKCDMLWIVFSTYPEESLMMRIPLSIGLLSVDAGKINTIRLPKRDKRPESTEELARLLLEITTK